MGLDEVLLDHAHCEKKAASMAINFLFRYPEFPWMLAPLSALAREELRHFEQMLVVIVDRGVKFQRLSPSSYAGRLMKEVRGEEPDRMLDMLLCASLIEARSCERMHLLHKAFCADGLAPDPVLARLYGGLLACEQRHHNLYVDIAVRVFGDEPARQRLAQLAVHEASILDTPHERVRMHS